MIHGFPFKFSPSSRACSGAVIQESDGAGRDSPFLDEMETRSHSTKRQWRLSHKQRPCMLHTVTNFRLRHGILHSPGLGYLPSNSLHHSIRSSSTSPALHTFGVLGVSKARKTSKQVASLASKLPNGSRGACVCWWHGHIAKAATRQKGGDSEFVLTFSI